MKLSLPLFLSTISLASAKNLRSSNEGRRLKKLDETCTALITLVENKDGPDETYLSCETSEGKTYRVKSANGELIKKNFEKGIFKSGETDLVFGSDAMIDEDNVAIDSFTPPGLKKKDWKSVGKRPNRKLAVTIDNNKTVLAVKVIASGSASSYNEAQLSDSIFGNAGDLWNLKQGYSDCSRGQLIINEAAARSGSNVSISNGVVTVDLGNSVSATANDDTMRNAVTNALNSEFGVTSPDQLADHVMYCLPPTVNWSGIAYAYINSWNSVYNDDWCTYPSVQMHEVGHNLNMHHSGEGSQQYADQSGMMGYSYSQDETPKMCFNGAKNWQFGWFTPRHEVVSSNYVGELRSTLEYDPTNPNPDGPPMLIKVANGGEDYFIAFNRATSYNAGTKEGQNQVMITQAGNGSNFVVSYLQAKLGAGASYAFTASGVPVTVSVQSINTTGFGFANISICFNGDCSTPSPTLSPTSSPTTPPTNAPTPVPTASPTTTPTSSPTPAPTEPTAAPTVAPTSSPTATPTKSPTPAPTTAPTQNCLQLGKAQCQTLSYCSWSGRFKSCSFNTSSPVSSPVAEPPVGGPGPNECAAVGESCREGVDCCSGACSGGKPSRRVCLAAGGPGPSECVSSGLSCDLGTCCNGCQRNGRWANTCK